MLKQVKIRVTRTDPNDKDRQITEFEPGIIQTDNIVGVLTAGGPGMLSVGMVGGKDFLIKATLEDLLDDKISTGPTRKGKSLAK
jgi:hypothetical protein